MVHLKEKLQVVISTMDVWEQITAKCVGISGLTQVPVIITTLMQIQLHSFKYAANIQSIEDVKKLHIILMVGKMNAHDKQQY